MEVDNRLTVARTADDENDFEGASDKDDTFEVDDEVQDVQATNEDIENKSRKKKPGVVYINRPPVFMKPVKVQHLLSQYGVVKRIFLQPEDDSVRKSRTKRGGSHKIKYTEGWIEFASRKDAKAIAASLNGKPVGGDRRSFHYEDLWNLKYLPGFQWNHLTEKYAYEKNVRKIRLRAELAAAKRETEDYMEKVVKGKRIKAIVDKKEKKRNRKASDLGESTPLDGSKGEKTKRKFKQLTSRSSLSHDPDTKARASGSQDWLSSVMS